VRRRLIAILLGFILVVGCVAATPGAASTTILGALHIYRAYGSPVATRLGVRCRLRPTCSRYAEAAVVKHGALKGSLMTARRLLRCTPLTPMGTVDLP
jgi:putative membrane protein insertion efficiency factor